MRWCLVLLLAAGCHEKPPESDLPLDGAFDSFRSPTDHGEIGFGSPETATLSATQEFHTWTFSVSASVAIHVETDLVPQHSGVDTVLYLYKRSTTGWGSFIERNDDDGRLEWSSIDTTLDAGDYRVLVKSYTSDDHGGFGLQVNCTGAGCTPATTCMFGKSASGLDGTHALRLGSAIFTSPVGLGDLDTQRIILALHESTHTDVATTDDAFAAADHHAITLVQIYDLDGARAFVGVEYGAGGGTYGAIFAADSTERVAAIHHTTLASCTVVAQTCALGHSFDELVGNFGYTAVSQRTVTKASDLTGIAADQALAAIRIVYSDASNLASGLRMVWPAGLDVVTLKDAHSGTLVDVYAYGAGDAADLYGAVFVDGGVQLAASIHESELYGCTVFKP